MRAPQGSVPATGPEDTWAWAPWVLAVLVVASVVVGWMAGPAETFGAIAIAVADAALTMVVVAPLLVVALRSRAGAMRALMVLFVLIL